MTDIRGIFLQTSDAARGLLSSAAVSRRWDSPSLLAEFSVRGLAGHLARAVAVVEDYLDHEADPNAPVVSAAEYYATAVPDTDLNSELHRGIRSRGEAMAAEGHEALLHQVGAAIENLRTRLAAEPADRVVQVFGEMVVRLDDYLITRVVELVVHADDLALSVDEPVPELPAEAFNVAIGALVEVARHRHGDLAVVRALTRRERDTINALRVL